MVYGYHTNSVCITSINFKVWFLMLKLATRSSFRRTLSSQLMCKLSSHHKKAVNRFLYDITIGQELYECNCPDIFKTISVEKRFTEGGGAFRTFLENYSVINCFLNNLGKFIKSILIPKTCGKIFLVLILRNAFLEN